MFYIIEVPTLLKSNIDVLDWWELFIKPRIKVNHRKYDNQDENGGEHCEIKFRAENNEKATDCEIKFGAKEKQSLFCATKRN